MTQCRTRKLLLYYWIFCHLFPHFHEPFERGKCKTQEPIIWAGGCKHKAKDVVCRKAKVLVVAVPLDFVGTVFESTLFLHVRLRCPHVNEIQTKNKSQKNKQTSTSSSVGESRCVAVPRGRASRVCPGWGQDKSRAALSLQPPVCGHEDDAEATSVRPPAKQAAPGLCHQGESPSEVTHVSHPHRQTPVM